jgi:glycosyltransferase involved in cell wall biosynthesis
MARQQTPRISVVMPTHNGERFLRAQLDSILAQTCGDFELIIVDDASGDGSFAILEEYARRDDRIVLSRNERNLGLLETLALLLGRARAPWIAISDHDDVWHPRKLETLLESAGEGAAAYCNSALIDARGEPLGLTIMDAIGVATPASGRDPLKLLWKNCVSGHAMIFRRELCAAFLPFSDDLCYDQQIAILAMANGGLAYCPQLLVQHRLHDRNYCNNTLLNKAPLDVRRLSPAERFQRRLMHRKRLVERFMYFEHRKLIPPQWRHVVNSDRLNQRWFDLDMFWFVLRHPELFTQRKRHHVLRLAYKFAKGAAWYRTVYAWRLRLSRAPGGGASR